MLVLGFASGVGTALYGRPAAPQQPEASERVSSWVQAAATPAARPTHCPLDEAVFLTRLREIVREELTEYDARTTPEPPQESRDPPEEPSAEIAAAEEQARAAHAALVESVFVAGRWTEQDRMHLREIGAFDLFLRSEFPQRLSAAFDSGDVRLEVIPPF